MQGGILSSKILVSSSFHINGENMMSDLEKRGL